MKQYTSKDQTAKLIELGFPKPSPKYIHIGGVSYDSNHNYSVGELIEFLPKRVDSGMIDFFFGRMEWFIRYEDRRDMPPLTLRQWCSRELIDSLFDACVTLKEEGGLDGIPSKR